jgi:putative membrane protein
MKHAFFSTALLAGLLGFSVAAQAAGDKGRDVRAKDNNTLSRADKSFIEKAMKDNQAELALTRLAQEKASSAELKQAAQKMANDHQKAGDELQAIASRVGYMPKMSDKEPGDVRKFSKMSGDKFDREFAKHMVKDHEKAVKLFKKEAQDGQAQEVWQFATKTLPVLEEHLRMSRELSGTKMSGESKRRAS